MAVTVITLADMMRDLEVRDMDILANAYKYDVEVVIQQFGTWAVTDYGMECLVQFYPIEKRRLRESDWVRHIAGKRWVDMADFTDCYDAAIAYHYPKSKRMPADPIKRTRAEVLSTAVRFRVLRRDGYRCQICGRSAADGVVLEVDHKIPRAHGGKNGEANLWTLCFDCNRGKGTNNLEAPRA